MSINYNYFLGPICILVGVVVILFAIGHLLARIIIALCAVSLINYGLRLRGLPPLQLLIPLLASRNRWF